MSYHKPSKSPHVSRLTAHATKESQNKSHGSVLQSYGRYHRTMSSDNPPVASYPFLSKDGGHNNNNNISRSIDKSSSVHEHQLDTETAALCQLKAELAIIPDHLKSELVHAQRVAPDLVDDEHLSKFLHAENFICEVSYAF